jgi:hypothetical protein
MNAQPRELTWTLIMLAVLMYFTWIAIGAYREERKRARLRPKYPSATKRDPEIERLLSLEDDVKPLS